MTDRAFRVIPVLVARNVRWLMYQSLIWPRILRYDPCRLSAPLDPKDRERLADPLVDCVRRDSELGCDLLGIEVLVDKEEAIELAARKARNARRHVTVCPLSCSSLAVIRRAVEVLQASPHPAQHCATPEQRVWTP
jgi:hypothetical protein